MTGARKLFDVLAAQRRFVFLAVALLSVAGVWTALRLPSAIYPELTFPRITIVVQGSSLGARQVVFSIARPIEEAVSIVPSRGVYPPMLRRKDHGPSPCREVLLCRRRMSPHAHSPAKQGDRHE